MFPKPIKKVKVKKGLHKEKKTTLAKEKRRAWKTFSLYMRTKWTKNRPCFCYTCDKPLDFKSVQPGHWVEGHSNAVYINEEFVRPQCTQCNIFDHGNQGIFRDRIRKELGDEKVDFLLDYSRTIVKITLLGYQALTQKYTKLLEEI